MPDAKGRGAVEISGELFLELMREGRVWGDDRVLRVTKGLPEDAELIGFSYEAVRDRWIMVIASSEWPIREPGEMLTRVRIEFRVEERSHA